MNVRTISLLASLWLLTPAAHAAIITVSGDYGLNTTGALTPVPQAPSGPPVPASTPSFTQTLAGFGSISGDINVLNILGTSFSLSITNVVLTVTTPANITTTDIVVNVSEAFQASFPGPYIASHSVGGTWTSATGNAVSLNTEIDLGAVSYNVLNPISITNTAAATSFSLAPAPTAGLLSSAVFTIDCSLRLRLDGVGDPGNFNIGIDMPGSADVFVNLVPAPGASGTLGIAGLAAVRRRRR